MKQRQASLILLSCTSNYVDRPREAAAEQLVRDYFCDNAIFPAKVFRKEPTFGLFVQVDTTQPGHGRGYRWVKDSEELESLALFHPLVKSLCLDVLNNESSLSKK